MIDEEKTIKELYCKLKEHEFSKQQYDIIMKMIKDSGRKDKEELEEKRKEAKEKFKVSTSTIRTEIIEIKRFIVENVDISDKILLTDSILEEYNKNR